VFGEVRLSITRALVEADVLKTQVKYGTHEERYDPRALALAITKLEEGLMWLDKARRD
jgi:hypothetical protein